jgi:hypothetical protein
LSPWRVGEKSRVCVPLAGAIQLKRGAPFGGVEV